MSDRQIRIVAPSLKMLPTSSLNREADRCCRNSECVAKMKKWKPGSSKSANMADHIFCHFSAYMRRAARNVTRALTGPMSIAFARSPILCTSPFHSRVTLVFGVGSKPKVMWIATGRIIARMADVEAVRDRAVADDPSNAVGSQPLSECGEHSVAGRTCALPFPTFGRLTACDKGPESGNLLRGKLWGHRKSPFPVTCPLMRQHCGGYIPPLYSAVMIANPTLRGGI